MTTPQSMREKLVEEFDNKFYHDHEEKGLTYLRNDVVGWLRTALTTLEAAAREEERERIATELDRYAHESHSRSINIKHFMELLVPDPTPTDYPANPQV